MFANSNLGPLLAIHGAATLSGTCGRRRRLLLPVLTTLVLARLLIAPRPSGPRWRRSRRRYADAARHLARMTTAATGSATPCQPGVAAEPLSCWCWPMGAAGCRSCASAQLLATLPLALMISTSRVLLVIAWVALEPAGPTGRDRRLSPARRGISLKPEPAARPGSTSRHQRPDRNASLRTTALTRMFWKNQVVVVEVQRATGQQHDRVALRPAAASTTSAPSAQRGTAGFGGSQPGARLPRRLGADARARRQRRVPTAGATSSRIESQRIDADDLLSVARAGGLPRGAPWVGR